MNDPNERAWHCYWEGGEPRAYYWSEHEQARITVTQDTPELWFDMLVSVGQAAAVAIYEHLFGATHAEALRRLTAAAGKPPVDRHARPGG